MRSTVEILAELEDNGRPDYEELRMACLVQKAILFLAHDDIRGLLKGGIAAAVTKQSYPKKNAELGISSWSDPTLRPPWHRRLSNTFCWTRWTSIRGPAGRRRK